MHKGVLKHILIQEKNLLSSSPFLTLRDFFLIKRSELVSTNFNLMFYSQTRNLHLFPTSRGNCSPQLKPGAGVVKTALSKKESKTKKEKKKMYVTNHPAIYFFGLFNLKFTFIGVIGVAFRAVGWYLSGVCFLLLCVYLCCKLHVLYLCYINKVWIDLIVLTLSVKLLKCGISILLNYRTEIVLNWYW